MLFSVPLVLARMIHFGADHVFHAGVGHAEVDARRDVDDGAGRDVDRFFAAVVEDALPFALVDDVDVVADGGRGRVDGLAGFAIVGVGGEVGSGEVVDFADAVVAVGRVVEHSFRAVHGCVSPFQISIMGLVCVNRGRSM